MKDQWTIQVVTFNRAKICPYLYAVYPLGVDLPSVSVEHSSNASVTVAGVFPRKLSNTPWKRPILVRRLRLVSLRGSGLPDRPAGVPFTDA